MTQQLSPQHPGPESTEPENVAEGSRLLQDPLLRDVPVLDGQKRIGNCTLDSFVGAGGMGLVYRGHHTGFQRDVAVKFLKPELAGHRPEFVDKFLREARVAAALTHENLIRVFDVGNSFGLHYIVMEFVDGESVQQLVRRRGALPPAEACRILIDAARGLAHAHRHRRCIIHRDVKPANILLKLDGRVKVADLGLAKPTEETDLTQDGQAFGSPAYMPLEQWQDARSVGPQADVYGLGATAYYMLTGQPAIQGDTPLEIMTKVQRGDFPKFADVPGVPRDLAAVLQRSVARKPEDRFVDAAELLEALEKNRPTEVDRTQDATTGTVTRSRRFPWRVAGPLLAVAVAAAVIVWPLTRPRPAVVTEAARDTTAVAVPVEGLPNPVVPEPAKATADQPDADDALTSTRNVATTETSARPTVNPPAAPATALVEPARVSREYEIVTSPIQADVRVDGKLVERDAFRGKGRVSLSEGKHTFRITTPDGEWVEPYEVRADDPNRKLVFDVSRRRLTASLIQTAR